RTFSITFILPPHPFKHRHLGRGSHLLIDRSHRYQTKLVSESFSRAPGPFGEFRPCPFEAVIAVTELTGRKRFPADVVLSIGRRQHNLFRARELEQDASEGCRPWWIELLDHFDNRRRVEVCQSFVAVNQRAMKELDPLGLTFRQPLQT